MEDRFQTEGQVSITSRQCEFTWRKLSTSWIESSVMKERICPVISEGKWSIFIFVLRSFAIVLGC